MSCNIFCAFLFSSGKYKIYCFLRSVSSRLFEKWFLICERNQFVRSNKLLLWSAEFLISFSLKVEMIISFIIRFLSFPTWCGNSCWIFLMFFEISRKVLLTRISYFFRFEDSREEKGLLKRRAGLRWIPCILIANEDCRYCFVNCGVLRLLCWCSAIRLGKSSLLYNFIVSLRRSLSSEKVGEWIFTSRSFKERVFRLKEWRIIFVQFMSIEQPCQGYVSPFCWPDSNWDAGWSPLNARITSCTLILYPSTPKISKQELLSYRKDDTPC